MRYHVMADIETLGVGDNALPIVIGAVKFNQTTILDKFEVGIDPDDAQRYGRAITGGTVLYWFAPEKATARQRLIDIPKVDLYSALSGFADWCRVPPGPIPCDQADMLQLGSIWGKGSTFDCTILRNAAEACRVEWPFDFRSEECYRTMAKRSPVPIPPFVGTPHVAVDDALNQALHLQQICASHGLVL